MDVHYNDIHVMRSLDMDVDAVDIHVREILLTYM